MSAAWPYMALRAPLPRATPVLSTDAKPETSREFIRSFIRSFAPLLKSSRVFVAVNRSFKSLLKSSLTNLFPARLLGGITRLTCIDVNGRRDSPKGVAIGADGRYLFTHPQAPGGNQGAIR